MNNDGYDCNAPDGLNLVEHFLLQLYPLQRAYELPNTWSTMFRSACQVIEGYGPICISREIV